MGVKDILRRYAIPAEAQSDMAVKPLLIVEIDAYQKRNRLIYFATLAVTFVLLALAATLVARDVVAGGNKLVLILSGSGLGFAGLLEMMRRAAREWAQSQLILGVARVSDEHRLQSLIDSMLKV